MSPAHEVARRMAEPQGTDAVKPNYRQGSHADEKRLQPQHAAGRRIVHATRGISASVVRRCTLDDCARRRPRRAFLALHPRLSLPPLHLGRPPLPRSPRSPVSSLSSSSFALTGTTRASSFPPPDSDDRRR